MATIKLYTDLEQSKKLAEILPLESADSHWYNGSLGLDFNKEAKDFYETTKNEYIPAWSLAALLNVLPKTINNETLFIETSPVLWHIGYRNIYTARMDNPVDACVDMILKLNELNML